jgi:hypothetical protein
LFSWIPSLGKPRSIGRKSASDEEGPHPKAPNEDGVTRLSRRSRGRGRVAAAIATPDSRVLAFGLAIGLFVGCSGSDSGSGYAEARQAYEQSATKRTDEVAGPIAAAYAERLTSGSTDDAFFRQFEGAISGLTESLCSQIKDLRGKAGSGNTKAQRLDDLRVTSEDLVQDGFVRAVLGRILSAPPEQREQLLTTVGVKASGTDSSELQGTAALKDVGLLDAQGQLAIPQRGTDQHVRYERWLFTQTPGFAGITSKLMGEAKAQIERCSSSD